MPQLECQVSKGVLAHEVALRFDGVEQPYESWADERQVDTGGRSLSAAESVPGFVRVCIVARKPESGRLLVQLPEEVVVGGRRVWVSGQQVKE